MKHLILAALVSTLFGAVAAAQNTSIYTSTRTSACRTITSNPDEGGSYEGECRGTGGYKVRLLEGDIRQTLNIIAPGGRKFELNFWGFYGGFSAIGEKIEWRTKRGVPVALIARFNVANPDDSTGSTSYLMVSKIGRTASCVTDIVPPMPKQNEEARRLADAAAAKPCKTPN